MTSLLCPVLILINLTSEPWNNKDKEIIKRAKYVCENDSRYLPCLKSVTKHPNQHYSVMCGDKK